MSKPPAFQFYPDDYLGGTMHFTDAEAGLYTRLLCVQWNTGSLPDDDAELVSYGKGNTPIHRVKAKFEKGPDGRLRNARMELERAKQQAYRDSRSANGKQGGRPCKPHGKHVVLKTKAQESSPSPSPSPVSDPDFKSKSKARPENLAECKAYAKERGLLESDGEWFWERGNGSGWTNGGQPIRDWRATVRAWQISGFFPSQKANNGKTASRTYTPPADLHPDELLTPQQQYARKQAELAKTQ